MITVVICKDQKGSYKGFYCMGHAEYAKKGQPDIVCAAVSAVTVGTVNALEELGHVDLEAVMNEETGFLKCDFHDVLQEKCIFLMDSMVLTLQNISREYGEKYLKVNFKEV